jgi:hypothetical protein
VIPKRIAGATRLYGAPRGWNPETDGDCGGLWVRETQPGRFIESESAWEPTPEELAILNAGGSVILRVVGAQPPVMIYVAKP